MSAAQPPSLCFVGAGRLAGSFLPVLHRAGWPILAVVARRLHRARALCRGRDIRATTSLTEGTADARVTLLAVPDRQLLPIAKKLATARDSWRQRTFLHHAGSLGTEVLAPLAERGASVGVLHPLQVLGRRAELTQEWLARSWARCEGTPAARRVATLLMSDLGMRRLSLRTGQQRDDRSDYHAAATLASNDLVALLGSAMALMTRSGVPAAQATAALEALASGTLAQIADDGSIGAALTGPVVRGDVPTVSAQLRRLRTFDAKLTEAHRQLSHILLEIAEKEGLALAPEEREALLQALGARRR